MYCQSEVQILNLTKDFHKSFPANNKIVVLGVKFEFTGRTQVQYIDSSHRESQFHGTDCNQISDTATKSQEPALRRNYFWLDLSFKLHRLKDVWGNVRFSREQLILALTGATCHWIINTRPVLANIEV